MEDKNAVHVLEFTYKKRFQKNLSPKLVEKTKNLKIGLPWEKDVFLGPIINEKAKKKFEDAAKLARQDGKILTGGNTLQDSQRVDGIYVEPTIVSGLTK